VRAIGVHARSPSNCGIPRHKLIKRLAAIVGEVGASDQLSEFAWLFLDQARIVEGEQLPDPPAFARRLATLLERGLPAAA
jgi:molecular chaperone HtpG